MDKVKVLHIITRLINGGAQKNTLLTINGLKKEGYDARLAYGFTSGDEGELITAAESMGIDLYYIPQMKREISPMNDIRAFLELYKLIKKEGFGIVHTHTSKAGILGRFSARLAGVPVIIHSPHGHIFDPEANIRGVSKGIFGIRFFVFLERLAARRTDKIITLTKLEIEQHLKAGVGEREKFIAIYSGIEIEKFLSVGVNAGEKKRDLQIPSGVPVLGTVGRLDSVKGHKFLLDAIPYIKRASQGIKVLIIGDGPLRLDLENQAKRLGVEDNVLFLGMRDDVPELLNCIDVFVLPSLYEGMGRALVEAEAAGVPVVATQVGGVPEVVLDGKTGILIPPKDPARLAEAVILLLKDKDKRISMGIEGRKFVTRLFGTEAMINKVSDLYEDMLKICH